MKPKHLPNREIELTEKTDFFSHINKGNAIVSYFKSNIDDLTNTNMFALYGKWGSGKSTLMKYIGKEHIDIKYLNQIRSRLSEEQLKRINQEIHLAPAWIAKLIKSVVIGE